MYVMKSLAEFVREVPKGAINSTMAEFGMTMTQAIDHLCAKYGVSHPTRAAIHAPILTIAEKEALFPEIRRMANSAFRKVTKLEPSKSIGEPYLSIMSDLMEIQMMCGDAMRGQETDES